ncbi:MAG TPA: hypothetical protein VGP44_04235, partial [Gemmatimonadales bacterium]|nr:hypothetical protein [Gemmatimonadales bacterium]
RASASFASYQAGRWYEIPCPRCTGKEGTYIEAKVKEGKVSLEEKPCDSLSYRAANCLESFLEVANPTAEFKEWAQELADDLRAVPPPPNHALERAIDEVVKATPAHCPPGFDRDLWEKINVLAALSALRTPTPSKENGITVTQMGSTFEIAPNGRRLVNGEPYNPDENGVHQANQALEDAVELAEEAMAYVSPYFIDKWDMEDRLARCAAALPPKPKEDE